MDHIKDELTKGIKAQVVAKHLEKALRELIEDFRNTKCTQSADASKRFFLMKAENALGVVKSLEDVMKPRN